ncbi:MULTISPECIES: hypothetical protein [unclassified Microcoleus]|nr:MULTISPECIES: hypothetical protein [unclassified Microcoleus]
MEVRWKSEEGRSSATDFVTDVTNVRDGSPMEVGIRKKAAGSKEEGKK